MDQAMKLGYAIIYVPDVLASVEFFEKAFRLKRRFDHESGDYGELDTGATALAFATHELGASNLPGGYVKANQSDIPLGMEIALVTDNVADAHARAIEAGAVSIKAPLVKPWGQTVSYVRCPDGTLVEICSPVSS
jgi:catechol 2,3-dioxygenase-like lactoylglutathione lyase family enzyme